MPIARSFRIFVLLILLLISVPAAAQEYAAYAWAEADLALLVPPGWAVPVAESGEDALRLTLSGGEATILLVVLPVQQNEDLLRAALEAEVAALDQLPLQYALDTIYGRGGLRIDTVSADRTLVGVARWGLLPDDRALLVASRAPAAQRDAFEDTLRTLLDSIVFSAALPPTTPTYRPVWSQPPGEQGISGVAAFEDRLYLLEDSGVQQLDTFGGVRVLDSADGSEIARYPFERPAQPTGIAVDGEGVVYIGDTVCRCVRRMEADGTWLDPLGSFGGNAPFSLAVAADGTIYATDKDQSGYVLRILGEPRNRTVGLNFNASAPPLVALDRSGQVWVVEWLGSLIDGSVSGAASLVDRDKATTELRFWLEELSPEITSALVSAPSGDLVFAVSGQGLLFVHASGVPGDVLELETPARALAFDAEGTLYVAHAEGTLRAFDTRGVSNRVGGRALAFGVPVQGRLDESTARQRWTFAGSAGEQVTLSAVDQSRTDAFGLGLDMALRLFAPDGSELAYNDDQINPDLFGVYDAQIPNFTLPQAGTYTVAVEWRQGSGTYTLGISGSQALELSADGVTRVDGRIQDVFPVQRWAFAGRAGDVLTFTMTAESGTLDPVLTLLAPDGEMLAYNDDASDLELDVNAQISRATLPSDGTYVIETGRYEGAGAYHLVIVSTDAG